MHKSMSLKYEPSSEPLHMPPVHPPVISLPLSVTVKRDTLLLVRRAVFL